MKKALLMTFAALAALTLGLSAQDSSFEGMLSTLPKQVAAAPAVAAPAAGTQAVAPAQREWLVLVFINGVNDLGLLGCADKSINDMEKVGSTDKMAVVVEYGILGVDDPSSRNVSFQRGSKTIYIAKDADPSKITSAPFFTSNDGDMGSAANLVRFVKRGLRRFPARKVAVILWNHGGGRLGISTDDVSKNHMEVDQLGAALAMIRDTLGRKIDVFATDACLMQMAGVAYEFKDSASVIVGSEEEIPGDSYPYENILGPLAANPGMDAEALGSLMVRAYGAHYNDNVTLSALRASALPGFTALLNKWVEAVKADPKAFKAATSDQAVDTTYNFSMQDSKDLYDYLGKVEGLLGTGSPAVKQAGANLRNFMTGSLIIRDTALPSMTQAHGLAIYIPQFRYNSANYEKFRFARDSLWDDYLRAMMEVRLKP